MEQLESEELETKMLVLNAMEREEISELNAIEREIDRNWIREMRQKHGILNKLKMKDILLK